MKEKNTLKSLLGIEQEDIAIVLGISRSHLAMYGIGKRSLPLHAKEEFIKILQFFKNKQLENKEMENFMRGEELYMRTIFEKEIQLNEYKIHVLGKKIKKTERLRNENLMALRLADYLDVQTDNARTAGMGKTIRSIAMEAFKRNNALLLKYVVRKETLEQQSKIIAMELNKDSFSFLRLLQNAPFPYQEAN